MFNNIIGLKPSCGRISCRGVVPACRSLDCVSVHALTCADAKIVMDVTSGLDVGDPYSRSPDQLFSARNYGSAAFRFGVPPDEQLKFRGDELPALYHNAIERLGRLGGQPLRIDYTPFSLAADLLYEGPWLAERAMTARNLLLNQPQAVHPVVASVLRKGLEISARATFEGMHRLSELAQQTRRIWDEIDLLVVPTAGAIYSIDDVNADPIGTNSNLGKYASFVNLLNLCAVAVPSGFTRAGLPFGVSLISQAGEETNLLSIASRFHRDSNLPMGASGMPPVMSPLVECPGNSVAIAVVGAHLSGQPLNYQLIERGARLTRRAKTAPKYRLYALSGTKPPKPGLVRNEDKGFSIELEVWTMPMSNFGGFVAAVPPPLAIGSIQLDDGNYVKGFICESSRIVGARDISDFGGWVAFLNSERFP